MTYREVTEDMTRTPGIKYLVAASCPIVASGRVEFHACVCASQLCPHLLDVREGDDGKRYAECNLADTGLT